MPRKGLEKGDGAWGRGKEPFLKRFFPLPQVIGINLYREQSQLKTLKGSKSSHLKTITCSRTTDTVSEKMKLKSAHTHDLSLPEWGPYSTRTFGLSCIHNPETGSRMDFAVMPGFYRRNFAVPDARRQSGGIPWESSADLRYYSYRQQLEWKDKVYADLSFISCGEKCRLISCKLVNRKSRSQDLALNLLCRLFPGLTVPCRVHGAEEVLTPRINGRGLNYDAYLPGEEPTAEPLPGGTVFPLQTGAEVSFEAAAGLKSKKVWLLKKTAASSWCFQQLPSTEDKIIHYTASEDEVLNRAFVMPDEKIPELLVQEENTVVQVEKISDEKFILSFGDGKCYALNCQQKPSFIRRYHVPDLDALFRTSDQVFQQHIGENYQRPGAKESAFAVVLQPLTIPARSEKEIKIYTAAGSYEEMVKFLNQPMVECDEVYPAEFSHSPYSFGAERMAATIMTNIIYPVRCNGELIRHHTPGRLWSSLYTWDSGFIGLGLLEMDIKRAEENLNAYLTKYGDDINAFVHHGTPLPVQIFLFYEIWNRTCDIEFLRRFYPGVKQMYLYLAGHHPGSTTRKHCTLPLICTWDYFYNSGGWDDYPPQWSRTKVKPTPKVIPMISSSVLIRAAKMLRTLGRIIGEDTSCFDQDIREISDALQTAWDPESGYFGYVQTDEKLVPVGIYRFHDGSNYNMGMDGVSPLLSGEITADQKKILWQKVTSPQHLWTKFGISAVDKSAAYFSLDGYWNGSIWMPHQWFLWKAALNDGLGKFAIKIAMTALKLWERETRDAYCCFEQFSISTGSGSGWHHFSGLSSPILCWYNACFKKGMLSSGYDVLVTDKKPGKFQLEISGIKGEKTSLIYCGIPQEITFNGKKIKFYRASSQVIYFNLPKASSGELVISELQ